MMLIADGGSTTANWWVVVKGRKEWSYFTTEGHNPHFVDEAYITASLVSSLPGGLSRAAVREVHFYGSGCMAGKAVVMERALRTVFPAARISAEVDLLATAHALLGRKAGFAAILGTGTNTCLYDGDAKAQGVRFLVPSSPL